MDLRLYLRVIGRFWAVAALGVALAAVLAFISYFVVDYRHSPHVTYRQSQTWKGTEVLMLTQRGFPWGRSVYPFVFDKKTGQLIPTARFADPSRFTALAVFYAQLANSDAVRALVGRRLEGSYSAKPVVTRAGGDVGSSSITQIVPLVEIDGFARTPEAALLLTRRVSDALRAYLRTSQADAAIPPKQRIVVQVLSTAKHATLARGRRLTIPIVAFLGVLIVTLGLVFVLENLWPRAHSAPETEGSEHSVQSAERARPVAEPADASPVLTAEGANNPPQEDVEVAPPAPVPVFVNSGRVSGFRPATLGRQLRAARLDHDLELVAVQARIEVPTRDLRALESDRLELLPSAKEGRHTLVAYAELLGLDPNPLLGEFDTQVASGRGPVNETERGTRWQRARVLSLPLALLAVAVGVLLFARSETPTPHAPAPHRPVATPAIVSHAQTIPSTASSAARPVVLPTTRTRPKHTVLVVSAARGSSWLVVRNRWSHGKVLYAAVLPQGHTVRFRRLRLWVRLGAAGNLDVSVNGLHPDAGLYGTLDALVTRSGLKKVPLTL
jgi:Helix-turn-helix domain/Domain of unknown function (DUF4115)